MTSAGATVVAFVSQKGGVGKSTLSRGLAREAAKSGLAVKICDLDVQQGSCVDWHRRRLAEGVEPVFDCQAYRAAEPALAEASRFDMLIVDAPARASEATQKIAERSSLVVQPTGAGLDDLIPAVKLFHELVRAGVPKKRLVFALNNMSTEAEEAAARTYLTEAGYAVLDGSLPAKASYRDAQNHGRAITETAFASMNARADTLLQSLIDRI
jgi:chromosome partitioning protein